MESLDATSYNLLGLEKKYWQAMVDKDLKTAISLTNFPCVVAGANGMSSVNQEQFTKMFTAHKDSIKKFQIDENPEVRLITPDTAIIAYKVNCTMDDDGKTKTVEAVDTSTWVKRGGQWTCAMHTETELLKH